MEEPNRPMIVLTEFDHGEPLIISSTVHAKEIGFGTGKKYYFHLVVDQANNLLRHGSPFFDTYDECVLAINKKIKSYKKERKEIES